MKYAETIFDLFYLLFAVIMGIKIFKKSKTKVGVLLGIAVITLGVGDSFHLVPRILNYFINADFNIYLGIGKLITSITMTVFYMILFWVYEFHFNKNSKILSLIVHSLVIIRVILCMLPGNAWVTNDGTILYAILRNIPFLILGIIICILYFKNKSSEFKHTWLYVLLSFLFYMPVVVGTYYLPILGMLMIPKTICYILMILEFNKVVKMID